jgi:hypothetical protein
MVVGYLLPAALALWQARRAIPMRDVQFSRPPRSSSLAAWSADALPDGVVAIAQETRTALDAVSDFARGRYVDLQMAVEPHLIAQAQTADCQTCLRHLLLDAISRASGGVLVTAMRRAGGVEIAVLDDGIAPAGARPNGSTERDLARSTPAGGTLSADYHPAQGTTILLRLPQPELRPVTADDESVTADDESAGVFADPTGL